MHQAKNADVTVTSAQQCARKPSAAAESSEQNTAKMRVSFPTDITETLKGETALSPMSVVHCTTSATSSPYSQAEQSPGGMLSHVHEGNSESPPNFDMAVLRRPLSEIISQDSSLRNKGASPGARSVQEALFRVTAEDSPAPFPSHSRPLSSRQQI